MEMKDRSVGALTLHRAKSARDCMRADEQHCDERPPSSAFIIFESAQIFHENR